ncbi:sulfatase [Bacteroidota bacterium]
MHQVIKISPLCILLFSVPLILSSCRNHKEAYQPNILFIAVDDLACVAGCYGDEIAKTPNLDQLANKGVLFTYAYNQMPLCNPARASLMTGLRPDRTEVYDLDRHFRESVPGVVTLPQLFKQSGWWTGRVGKIYHYNVPAGIGTNGLDDPESWNQVVNPKGRDTEEEHLITNAEPHRPISAALSWLAADGTDEEQTDGMIASEAIVLLEQHKEDPFFLAVGFFRPHTPYVAPKKYFDLYPFDSIHLPWSPEGDRNDIPQSAFAHNCPIPNYGLPDTICRQALQAYYASVSFVDAQVGRLLRALDELNLMENTIIVLWSDHGYHLGEHEGIWQKRTLFEESARAPFMIYDPQAQGNGIRCRRIVEFVDIYPTLAGLCGLEPPEDLDGRSLKPLLNSPDMEWNGSAFTQILRPGNGEPVMGRSIRTERWRYTEWNEGHDGQELYNHSIDPNEFTNLAGNPEYSEIIRQLRLQLEANTSGKVPETPFNPSRL